MVHHNNTGFSLIYNGIIKFFKIFYIIDMRLWKNIILCNKSQIFSSFRICFFSTARLKAS